MIRAALRIFAAAAIAAVSTLPGLFGTVRPAYADPMEVFTLWPLADATETDHPEWLIGFNPAETVADPSGLTRQVTSTGQLTIVSAANALLHEGTDPSGVMTTRGPNGLIYLNPATNQVKSWGANIGFAAGIDVNRSQSTLRIPSAPPGVTAFGAGDVWATIRGSLGDGPLYVHLRGTNWFRYYQPVIGSTGVAFGAKGVSVDPSTGLVYFSDESTGTVNRLNPETNELTTWILGGFVHYLKVRNGLLYVTVSQALATPGQDALVRLNTNSKTPELTGPNVTAWPLGVAKFCSPQCDPLSEDVPDGIDVEGSEVWFAETQVDTVARLDTSSSTLTEFAAPLSVRDPQQIGVQGGGTSVQSFFTEGDGEAVSMVKPKANVGKYVKPVDAVAMPVPSCGPPPLDSPCTFTDAYILPDVATIPPVTRNVSGIPVETPNGTIWRFPAPAVPTDRGGSEAEPRHPAGITDVTSPMTVYGTYLAPPIGGPANTSGPPVGPGSNSALFRAEEPNGPPAAPPPALLPLPGWRRVSGNGAIAVASGGGTKPASFVFVVERKQEGAPITGRFHYRNPATGETVLSKSIQSVTVVGTTATIQGSCVKNGSPCTFTAVVQDNQISSPIDTFTINGSGISPASGTLSRGDITIRTK
jgi:streptogramin lyase